MTRARESIEHRNTVVRVRVRVRESVRGQLGRMTRKDDESVTRARESIDNRNTVVKVRES